MNCLRSHCILGTLHLCISKFLVASLHICATNYNEYFCVQIPIFNSWSFTQVDSQGCDPGFMDSLICGLQLIIYDIAFWILIQTEVQPWSEQILKGEEKFNSRDIRHQQKDVLLPCCQEATGSLHDINNLYRFCGLLTL